MLPWKGSTLWCLTALFCTQIADQVKLQQDFHPEFLAPLENLTVTQGRDAHFTCVVNNLGDYKVAWIKSDSKAILAIHSNMVALNPRLSVTYNGYNTWKLHVANVQADDTGTFMCQVNTDPMMSQMGFLEVVVPPDILNDVQDSGSGDALEGGSVRLQCTATGIPTPSVTWKRHGSKEIVFRHENGKEKFAMSSYDGEFLLLSYIQREDAGAYYCIASNGVPPSISKRYHVHVLFSPLVKLSNQLVGAPVGSDVQVQCYVESSPTAMNSWYRDNGDKLLDINKYVSTETLLSEYSLYMNLTIRRLEKRDFGGYHCSSVNALGKAEGSIRLLELQLPPDPSPTATHQQRFTTAFKNQQKKPTSAENNHGNQNRGRKLNDRYPKPELVTASWADSIATDDSNLIWYSNTPPWVFLNSGFSNRFNSEKIYLYFLLSILLLIYL